MSSVSVTSPKPNQDVTSELVQELDSIKALNRGLRAYLEYLRLFKNNLSAINMNCKQLSKVNAQWVDTLKMTK